MQKRVWLFYYFNLERNYDVLKSKSPCILLKTLIKTKQNRKWLTRHTVLERQTFPFNSYKNRKLEVKLSWVGARIFCTVYFVRRKFFQHLCFISVHSVLNTLLEHTYFYISKNMTSYTFLLGFKIVESLQCILKVSNGFN